MLAFDQAYADEFWERQDRLDDHTPADFLAAFPAYAYRVDESTRRRYRAHAQEQSARAALYPVARRDVQATPTSPPIHATCSTRERRAA